ncbi:hamartin-like, partial [Plectropomus leopardus]|uniref:hamartin-like n=1 Tax=Plectropomus leopardus TaxID=160734 RepID=UPI001C4C8B00
PPQGEELQSLRSQLLLVHSQLQYERFKRQQHAIRNRRLLRRVINATSLEEHNVAMVNFRQRLQSELQECQSRLRDLEAELQRANNMAYNAEHQLTELSVKLCNSEQLQQQMFLLNQQLVLLRETNRALSDQLEAGETHQHTEKSMLQCSVGKEYQRLRDSDVQQRQKLEAANHRIAELESQLAKKDQLILDQKKLLEDTKTQSRGELSACESRCAALRRVTQTLQMETLHLYSQIHLDASTHSRPQDVRPNGGSFALPAPHLSHKPRPSSSSSVGIINGAVETFSTSPLHLPSCSSSPLSLSPIESPLAVGSFLEQHARQLFRSTNQSQEEEEQQEEEEEKEEEEEQEEEEVQPESPPLGQEAEEATLLAGSPQMEPPSRAAAPALPAPPADLTLAVRQRRHELSIMDYDETLPEY